MSFTHSQSHQLRTAIFILGVLYALFQQSWNHISLTENVDFASASGTIEARPAVSFSKSKLGPNPTQSEKP